MWLSFCADKIPPLGRHDLLLSQYQKWQVPRLPQTSILVAIIEESAELGACSLDNMFAPVHKGYYNTKNSGKGGHHQSYKLDYIR